MEALQHLPTGILAAFVLHVLRAGAFLLAMPVFGSQKDSRVLRLVLAVASGGMFFALQPNPVDLGHGSALELGVLAVREVLVGLGAGLACSMMVHLMTSAGELISHEMGFAMAQAVNPETGRNSTVVSQLFQLIGFLLILQLDLHHGLLRFLNHLYEWIPVGSMPDFESIYEGLRELIGLTMEFSVQYALPVLAVMLLLTATLVVLARAVQNINLMEFSFGLRILLALLSSAWFLSEGTDFLKFAYASILERAALAFGAA